MCIQLEQQVSNNFRVDWEFIMPPVTGLQVSQGPSLVLEVKKALDTFALSTSLFVR